jgi:four helix bundle protein
LDSPRRCVERLSPYRRISPKGFKKRTPREKIRVLNISQGSLVESRYYLILAEDPDYANTAVLLPKLEEISRMLEAYIRAIETNHKIVRR